MDLPSHQHTELSGLADCRKLVDTFYGRVRADPLLGPIFAAHIPDAAWPAHLERMAGFWFTVLFGEPLYHGDPLARHRGLPIHGAHYERWLALWAQTLDELFQGARAAEAKERARRMARVLALRASA